ncbi:hypothetical protein NESM_000854600 [Novymonas esmeraldas]|uniref:Uncharacterized protein n=1 Tax=Novymonas esmeraldas TaxID=1808958 RepID=A0AAW0F0G1_9TRYP
MPPSSSSLRRVRRQRGVGGQEGLVYDHSGRPYVAMHPIYSSSNGTRACVLAFRITVCLLSLVVLVLSIVGQIVPYLKDVDDDDTWYYTVWEEQRVDDNGDASSKMLDSNAALAVFAILTGIFALVSFILAAVYASQWARAERERRAEERDSAELQSKHGRRRESAAPRNDNRSSERRGRRISDSDSDSFPYTNERVLNSGLVASVPHEEREANRRRLDRDMGIAIFSMLLCAAVCGFVTVILMGVGYSIDGYGGSTYQTELVAGFALFLVAFLLAVAAFILLAVPAATRLYLCCPPPVEDSELMAVREDEEDETTVPPPTAPRNPYQTGYTNAATAHGGGGGVDGHVAHGIPMALPGPPVASLLPSTAPPSGGGAYEMSERPPAPAPPPPPPAREGEYTTGVYFRPPPQLFPNVKKMNAGA